MTTVLKDLNSECLESVSYTDGVMKIEFVSGTAYEYNVPRKVFGNLAKCKYKGRGFNRLVKGNYAGVRVA